MRIANTLRSRKYKKVKMKHAESIQSDAVSLWAAKQAKHVNDWRTDHVAEPCYHVGLLKRIEVD